jgi:hypothetical protein
MRPAVVDMPVAPQPAQGDPERSRGVSGGRVLLFATNPIYRWQNWGEFNMVFNALMNYNDLGAAAVVKKADTTAAR